MKRIYWFVPLLIVSLTIFSCKSSKKASATDTKQKNEVKQLILYEKPMDSLTTDYYDIDSVFVKDQLLTVYVSYGGGCGEADFDMYYQPQKILVMPHRTYLFLKLTDNDPCRSIVTKELQFDLSVMDKEAKTGGVVLHLGEEKILYKISTD